ncbi:hypothetical protein DXG03_009570 [Asterophora parasitica]|uniref:Methyltransferase type 12 domain-containing protein n=1 Tax=Asterophora parasitica TaxID=117018 RepID=A0A9P7G4R2_9AGAR|nr:hypothetical protein DXG03_009570 [Asterophora parasitica]
MATFSQSQDLGHHFATNKANWDDRAPLHAQNDAGYKLQQFIDDPSALSNVVKFDVPRLPPLQGKRVVHLQCHIGTDTLSLSRLGAAEVVGLDFSGESIKAARQLVADTGESGKVTFVEGNVYDAVTLLDPVPDSPGSGFDVVFTGVGALCWLPSVERWASIVHHLLRPGGVLFIREGHPVLWAVDEQIVSPNPGEPGDKGGPVVRLPYFEHEAPTKWDDDETYVDTKEVKLQATRTYAWNHGLGEIVTALLGVGLQVELLEEHTSVPWQALPGQMVKLECKGAGEVEGGGDEWVLKGTLHGCLPLSYTLRARKVVT